MMVFRAWNNLNNLKKTVKILSNSCHVDFDEIKCNDSTILKHIKGGPSDLRFSHFLCFIVHNTPYFSKKVLTKAYY